MFEWKLTVGTPLTFVPARCSGALAVVVALALTLTLALGGGGGKRGSDGSDGSCSGAKWDVPVVPEVVVAAALAW